MPATAIYWTVAQVIAHHTSNSCDLHHGDLLGTGTICASSDHGLGSLMELGRADTVPVTLPGGETRTFLEDGDEVIRSGRAAADGSVPIGFRERRGTVMPEP